MNTDILKVKGDWNEVMNDCRSTVGKEAKGEPPKPSFIRRILIAEHSPIRDISIKWKWENIPNWVATHWSRHKWECFVRTQRSDRTGINRDKLPQDQPVDFTGEANVQHLIDTMRKRLCHQASSETRQYAENLKMAIANYPDMNISKIADVLVPNCIYRNGCPEMACCGMWQEFVNYCKDQAKCHPGEMTIRRRYNWYNDFFETKG